MLAEAKSELMKQECKVDLQRSTGRLSRMVNNELGAQFQCQCLAGRPSNMNSYLPTEILQNSMAVQQRLQKTELQFEKFSTPSTYSCWEMRFKTQVSSCSDFSLGGTVMDHSSGDGRFSG